MRVGLSLGRCVLLTAGMVIGLVQADASLVTFTSRSDFEAAARSLTTVTFENISPMDSAQDFPDGLTINGVTFQMFGAGPAGSGPVTVYGADFAAQSPPFNTGTGAILAWTHPNQPETAYVDVRLQGGRTAVGLDLWAQNPAATTIRAIVNSGEATENFDIVTTDRPASSFFGVVSDPNVVLLVRFAIPTNQAGLILDNVSVGVAAAASPVPEPGTLALLCAGLSGLALFRFSRRERLSI